MTEQDKRPNLYEQTKDMYIHGPRLTPDAEILCEVQDWVGVPTSRSHIRRIMEYVPDVFPEDWQCPDRFDELNHAQQAAYFDSGLGGFPLPLQYIEAIIKTAVTIRDIHINKQQPMEDSNNV